MYAPNHPSPWPIAKTFILYRASDGEILQRITGNLGNANNAAAAMGLSVLEVFTRINPDTQKVVGGVVVPKALGEKTLNEKMEEMALSVPLERRRREGPGQLQQIEMIWKALAEIKGVSFSPEVQAMIDRIAALRLKHPDQKENE